MWCDKRHIICTAGVIRREGKYHGKTFEDIIAMNFPKPTKYFET